jgi:hypothetical protein
MAEELGRRALTRVTLVTQDGLRSRGLGAGPTWRVGSLGVAPS